MADDKFIVYELIDPRCGKPFYVGKGQPVRPSAAMQGLHLRCGVRAQGVISP